MHNGYCAKWSCESTSSATSGRCEGQYYGCDKVTVNLSYQRQGQSHTEDILASFINTETLQFTLGGRTFEMQCGSKSHFQQNPTATYGSTGMGCMWEGEFDDNLNALGIYNFHIHSVKCSASSCNAGKTESSCKSQSSSCTRTPPSSSSSSSLKCYRQGTTAAVADSECVTLSKPQCPPASGSNPPSNSNSHECTNILEMSATPISTDTLDSLNIPMGGVDVKVVYNPTTGKATLKASIEVRGVWSQLGNPFGYTKRIATFPSDHEFRKCGGSPVFSLSKNYEIDGKILSVGLEIDSGKNGFVDLFVDDSDFFPDRPALDSVESWSIDTSISG